MPATPADRPSSGPIPTALTRGAAVAHPFLLLTAVRTGPYRSTELRLFLTAVAVGLVLPLARRNPLAALVPLLAGLLAAATTRPDAALLYLPVLAADAVVGRIAVHHPPRILVPAALGALAVQIAAATYTTSGQDVFVSTAVALALALLTAGLLGRSVRERRDHTAELRAATTAEAVAAERLRIARELHDVVAHSIGVIAIQAGVGRRVIETQPAEARNALATIETTSRETLAGLRRTLGALRGAADDGRPAPRDPAPGLADLERLAASTADAGVRVELRHLGNRDGALPPEIDLAAYRIVQESLTNVVRHAATPTCRVTVERRTDTLLVEIADDGRGTPGAESGGGYGLVGMRERAALLGGSLTAGPRPGGGFHVTALLPLPEGAP
ncbi:sensor histidine kinase [Streptomyces sp. NPDC059695]|uniref:sensor histidine kinase n=1 Tax=Streptomyces sp. NPDC059695 TaxID=3346910 RepID=UPI003684B6DB